MDTQTFTLANTDQTKRQLNAILKEEFGTKPPAVFRAETKERGVALDLTVTGAKHFVAWLAFLLQRHQLVAA